MPKSTNLTTSNNPSVQVCDCCKQQFDRRGFAAHTAACLKKAEQKRKDEKFYKMQDVAAQKRLREGMDIRFMMFKLLMLNTLFDQETPPKPRIPKPWENPGLRRKKKISGLSSTGAPFSDLVQLLQTSFNWIVFLLIEPSGNTIPAASSHSAQAASRDPAKDPQKNDVRRDFHEKSGLPSEFIAFDNYYHNTHNPSDIHNPTPETSDAPWKPFGSLSEFEFAEVALEAALNKKQVDKLLKIVQRCIKGEDGFDLQSHNDLTSAWKDAAAMVSPVRSKIRY
jgi:hypothetical protein